MSWLIEWGIHTNHDRSKVDWGQSCIHKLGILVINFRSEKRDITTLCGGITRQTNQIGEGESMLWGKLTPYDSPAMWNARPLNLVKFSKNIETKAAMSLAASSVVP